MPRIVCQPMHTVFITKVVQEALPIGVVAVKDHVRLLRSDHGDQMGPNDPPSDADGGQNVLGLDHDGVTTALLSDMAQLLAECSSFGHQESSRAQADDMQWISASLANTGGSGALVGVRLLCLLNV